MHTLGALVLLLSHTAFADGICHSWGAPVAHDALPTEINELSGLVMSPSTGLLWAHNDSAGGESLFALDADGTLLGAVTPRGADNADWEDLGFGPCAESECACLYLADIGDNYLQRLAAAIYRVAEPEAGDDGAPASKRAKAEAIPFIWPDGARDAEALAVHPQTGEVLILTKVEAGDTEVYGFDDIPVVATDEGAPFSLLFDLDLLGFGANDARVTGAAVSPGARQLAVRTEHDLLIWAVAEGQTLRAAIEGEPTLIDTPDDEGESITFSPDGQTLYMAGEGVGATLWTVPCDDWEETGDADILLPCPTRCGCSASPGRQTGGWLAFGALLLAGRRRATTSGSRRAARPRR